MTTFIIIGSIGLCLLVVSMILGELIDFGDGTISGTSLGVGAVVFGALGAIATANDLPTWTAYAGSAVAAVLVVILVQRLVKSLADTEDGTARPLAGLEGVATSRITTTAGEVSLDGELERRLAWANQVITEGTRIVVVEETPGRVLVAPRWPSASSTTPRRWPQST
ncbi:NfeD-like C-terminal, partner-binding [Sanguibacter gelidistatuariae]|uniref:NfeD-like C-terminal, partner-binding n=1 Tax=Sanguibacter gelidistatuariae TaxID=1814289 RepID=A0A1G6GZY8_9MICO|nr:hypothetical protein [Sanguibacter gelidistatuariae]SDB87245.1 NfeD-like C-terminal, partner-binding [Sanguibacter gelidistatuariae]